MTNSLNCRPLKSITIFELKTHFPQTASSQSLNTARILKHAWPRDVQDFSSRSPLLLFSSSPRTWQPKILPPNLPSFLPSPIRQGQSCIESDISQPLPNCLSRFPHRHFPYSMHIKCLALKGPRLTQTVPQSKFQQEYHFQIISDSYHYKWTEYFPFFLLFSKCDQPLQFNL